MQEWQAPILRRNSRRELDSLITVGSAIAWGALAVSLWGFLERSRTRRLRRQISNRLLSQVFPKGRLA